MKWIHWRPAIAVSFAERSVLRRTVGNSLWLLADQVFRMGVSFLVSLWVIRHLGPLQFGLLNFAAAFCAPFSALVLTNLNGLLVRELVRDPDNDAVLLGTATVLKLSGAVAGMLVGAALAATSSAVEARALPLILLVLTGSVLSAGEVSDLWFQSRSRGRVSAWVRSAVSLLVSVVKVGLILTDAPLVWFAAAGVLEIALCSLGWGWALIRVRRGGAWRWDGGVARRLLVAGWPIIFAGVAMQVQAYYDQVLLAGMRGPQEVGQYAAGLRLVALFGFLPMSLATAAAPELTRAHQDDRALYLKRLRNVYRAVLALFAIVAAPLVLIPADVVDWILGDEYAATATLLPLMAGRLLLTNLGVARSLHLTNEGLFKHALLTAVCGTICNLGLNWLLIPVWGPSGCAVAALLSFTLNILLLEWLDPRARIALAVLGEAMGIRRSPR